MQIKRGTSPIIPILLIGLLLTVSCSSQKYDPNFWHQNFVSMLQKNVGHDFDNVRNGETGGWALQGSLIGKTNLPNDYLAYKYRHLRTCHYLLIIESKTNIVAEVKWEGDKEDCIIVP